MTNRRARLKKLLSKLEQEIEVVNGLSEDEFAHGSMINEANMVHICNYFVRISKTNTVNFLKDLAMIIFKYSKTRTLHWLVQVFNKQFNAFAKYNYQVLSIFAIVFLTCI